MGVTYHKFICSTYKKYGAEACSCHLIQEDVLMEIVKEALNKLVFNIINMEKRISNATEKEKAKNIFLLQKEQNEHKENLKEIMNLKTELYSDYKLGIITLSEYQEMKAGFDGKCIEQEELIKDIEKQIADIQNKNFPDNKFSDRLQSYLHGIVHLTRKMIVDFIEEIVVDNEKNIKIKFKFEDEIKKYQYIFDKKTVQ